MNKETFSIKEAIKFGWNIVIKNLGLFAQIYAIIIVANIFFDFLIKNTTGVETRFLYILLTSLQAIFLTLVSLGILRISLDLYEGKKAKVKDIFSQRHFLLTAIIATILFYLMVLSGFFLFVIPGIYLTCRFFFYNFFIVDKKAGPIDSLRQSWRATQGKVLNIFLLILAIIGINILGFLVFVIGMLFTSAVSSIAFAYVYRNLSKASLLEVETKNNEEKKENEEELSTL